MPRNRGPPAPGHSDARPDHHQELRLDPRRVLSAWEAARVRGGRLACGAGDGTTAPGDFHRPAVSHAHGTSAPWGRPRGTGRVVRKNSGRCSWSCFPPAVTAIVTGPVTAAREGRAVSACARARPCAHEGAARPARATPGTRRPPPTQPGVRPAVRLGPVRCRPAGQGLDGAQRAPGRLLADVQPAPWTVRRTDSGPRRPAGAGTGSGPPFVRRAPRLRADAFLVHPSRLINAVDGFSDCNCLCRKRAQFQR